MQRLRFELGQCVTAVIHQVERVEEFLLQAGCNSASAQQMAIAAEEILTNIARDAWAGSEPGSCVVEVDVEPAASAMRVRFRTDDDGVAFDPTQAADPDIDASLEDRDIGGLGILLVRDMTDEQVYERADGHNVLTVTKLCPLA